MEGSHMTVNKIKWAKVRLLWTSFPREENVYGPLNISPYKPDKFCHTSALFRNVSTGFGRAVLIHTQTSLACILSYPLYLSFQILALVAVRKGMDYLFSQHDLSFLDDVIPEKDKKKKEDEKKKKKKKGSLDSDNDDVRGFLKFRSKIPKLVKQMWKL